MLFGSIFLGGAIRSSDGEIWPLFLFIGIIAFISYIDYQNQQKKKQKIISHFHRYGFQNSPNFRNNNTLQINYLPQYFPLAESAKLLFLGYQQGRELELIVNHSRGLPSLRVEATGELFHTALIVKDVKNIPNFSITPKKLGDSLFTSQSQKLNDILPTAFSEKYHIQGSVQDIREVPTSFFDFIANQSSALFLESNGSSLAIYKEGEVISNTWEIQNILTRSEILLDLLQEDSALQKSHVLEA